MPKSGVCILVKDTGGENPDLHLLAVGGAARQHIPANHGTHSVAPCGRAEDNPPLITGTVLEKIASPGTVGRTFNCPAIRLGHGARRCGIPDPGGEVGGILPHDMSRLRQGLAGRDNVSDPAALRLS
ncbi:hypothetical protein [Pseudarthrobacter sp. NPDC080039]|uniref:hypothetical protein n=1 Tax=unclassified Pseudarthrobacter TaxID=2647000 RepID=UPI0034503FFE